MAVAFPEQLLSPGPLVSGHQKHKNECLSCHNPFKGSTAAQCISCHKLNEIGIKRVDGTLFPKKTEKLLFHRGVEEGSCIACHSDHKGDRPAQSYKPFVHEQLSASMKRSCITCHRERQPQDALHRSSRENCSACHTTKRWKPATFNHESLTGKAANGCIGCHKGDEPQDELHGKSFASCGTCHTTKRWKPASFNHSKLSLGAAGKCISCHKRDLPGDEIHRLSGSSCGSCHSTKRWEPATFNHNRYFRLDGEHRASCTTCHTEPGNYKKYSCYGCHEHSPSTIAREHSKEGISNYQNCIKCHRNSSESGDD